MLRERPSARTRSARRLAVGAVSLLAVACGGGDGAGDAGGDGGGGGVATTVAKVDDRPIEDRLGFDQAGIQQRQTKVENLVRDCMDDQGFDYTPVDPAAQRAALVGSATLSEDDFEKQFGYGITTLYKQRRREAASGPNAEYRKSLPAEQRTAYDRALYGKNVGTTFNAAVDSGDFADLGGCTKDATEEVFGGAETLTTLQTKLDELDTRIEADGRMVAANKEWSKCMREAGYSNLDAPDEVDSVLEEKLEDIVGPDIRFGVGSPEPKYDEKALTALQREEVAIVKADIECEEEHIEEVEETVRKEFEQDFAEQNADFLKSVPPA